MYWLLGLAALYLLTRGATMALAVKSGALLSTRPEVQVIRAAVDRVWRKYDQRPTITSGMEGHHKRQSKHYEGLAEDYRTKDIAPPNLKRPMFAEVAEILGRDYDVIFESEGLPNEHLHIEYDPLEG